MNQKERQKNIEGIFKMAKHLDRSGKPGQAEELYLESLKQSEKYLGSNSPETGQIILECIDFYDRNNRDEDSILMQKRLRRVADYLISKCSSSSSL